MKDWQLWLSAAILGSLSGAALALWTDEQVTIWVIRERVFASVIWP